MKRSTILALGLWVLIPGGAVIRGLTRSPEALMDFPPLPWPFLFLPLVVVVGAFVHQGPAGEAIPGRWVDSRFGQGSWREFIAALKPELLLAAMCLGNVFSGLVRAVFFKTPVMPLDVMGFFAIGGVAFLAAHLISRRREGVRA
jgi:hypothetical protein